MSETPNPRFAKLDQEKLKRLKEWFNQSEEDADDLYMQNPPPWGEEEGEEENPSDRNNLYYSGG